jgi:hypothetical protein
VTIAFLIEPEAEDELEAAVLRYENERSGLGQRLLDAVTETFDQIAQFP